MSPTKHAADGGDSSLFSSIFLASSFFQFAQVGFRPLPLTQIVGMLVEFTYRELQNGYL